MILSKLARRTLAGLLVAGALSFPARPAVAQGDDAKTLAAYRLTESGLRSYYKVMSNLAKAVKQNPSLVEALESVTASGDDDIATMAAKYDRAPVLKSAITGAGITSTAFATFSLSYIQAGMAYGLMTQAPHLKEPPKGTPKENVDFVRANQALIQQLDKELKALMSPDSDAEDASE